MNHEVTRTELIVSPTVRSSNLELFRILLMLMIIAHHYVVNSELLGDITPTNLTGNALFLSLYGWGGKTGINCFILITGYFMCRKDFSWRKFFKLVFEVYFYATTIYLIFLLTGYETCSLSDISRVVLYIPADVGHGFIGSFICLYLLIPFINKMIQGMDKRQYQQLLIILLVIFTGVGTFVPGRFYEYIGWYVTVYLIGGYIRIYGIPPLSSLKRRICFLVVSHGLAFASILFILYYYKLKGGADNIGNIYYFVNDSNKLFAVLCSVSLFVVFKNINTKKTNIYINKVATATFGVLLIHGNSNTMRRFLWYDLLNNDSYYNSQYLWIHAILSVVGVYAVCVMIDLLRIRLIERPLFGLLDKKLFLKSSK